jgi:hypothetical protein
VQCAGQRFGLHVDDIRLPIASIALLLDNLALWMGYLLHCVFEEVHLKVFPIKSNAYYFEISVCLSCKVEEMEMKPK